MDVYNRRSSAYFLLPTRCLRSPKLGGGSLPRHFLHDLGLLHVCRVYQDQMFMESACVLALWCRSDFLARFRLYLLLWHKVGGISMHCHQLDRPSYHRYFIRHGMGRDHHVPWLSSPLGWMVTWLGLGLLRHGRQDESASSGKNADKDGAVDRFCFSSLHGSFLRLPGHIAKDRDRCWLVQRRIRCWRRF